MKKIGYRYEFVYNNENYGLFHGQKSLLLKLSNEGKIVKDKIDSILFNSFESQKAKEFHGFLEYPKIIGKYCFSNKGAIKIEEYIKFLKNFFKKFEVDLIKIPIEIHGKKILYKDEYQYCLEV